MVTIERTSPAPPEAAWPLLSRPARWHEWAPHVRGAWGLGTPEVEPGRRGFVRLLGALPVPVRIVDKQPGRAWTWEIAGAVRMAHRVSPRAGGGCVLAVELSAPAPLEAALGVAYGPVVGWVLERLARQAAVPDSSG